jgi:ABC-type sugar transport system permease subunit
MKTLFIIPMLIMAVISGMVSLHLFQKEHYDFSALLTLTSFVSMTLLVTLLGSKKITVQ